MCEKYAKCQKYLLPRDVYNSTIGNLNLAPRPILSKDLDSYSQVDLTDMQSYTDSQYKWHLTNFSIHPLRSKRTAEGSLSAARYICFVCWTLHSLHVLIANTDIKDITAAWLSDNSTHDWSLVQNQTNTAYNAGIKCSPYSALSGSEPKKICHKILLTVCRLEKSF